MPARAVNGHADVAGASPPPKSQPASPASAKANGKAPERPDKATTQAWPHNAHLLYLRHMLMPFVYGSFFVADDQQHRRKLQHGRTWLTQAPEDTWAGDREPVEAAANMLITRVAFDLLRAPSFREAAAAYIQRKLDQLRYPAYIGPLKVGGGQL